MITNDQLPSDFFLGLDRAMVSLGPLSPKRFCTYACAFCYVHADFQKYPNLGVPDILSWLGDNEDKYSIVYISGDTDSFAKPRTSAAVDLVRGIVNMKKDVLFTTRAPLEAETIAQLGECAEIAKGFGRLVIGCISISRLKSAPHIEPKPVPSPERRIEILKNLHDAKLWTVLAVRPFLPVIPADEYCEIVRRCSSFADVVLGETWYADEGGMLEEMVLGPGKRLEQYTTKVMDFDSSDVRWRVWEATEVTGQVARQCESLGIPFFMRSSDAVDHIRALARARL